MNGPDRRFLEAKVADYNDRITRLNTEPRKLPDPYADGFIRGLTLVVNDLNILLREDG